MSSTWMVVAVAAMGGGLVGGVTARAFSTNWEDEPPVAENGSSVADTDDAADTSDARVSDSNSTDEQVAALRTRLSRMERRVSLLTQALSQADPEALEGVLGDDDAKEPDDVDVADPVFEAAVLDIMERDEERRDVERQQARTERRQESAARMLAHLTTVLGLTEAQQRDIEEAVAERHAAREKLWRSDERPVTRREWREKMEKMQKKLDERLAEVMTGPQLEEYLELDSDDQLFRGGRRGRGPR